MMKYELSKNTVSLLSELSAAVDTLQAALDKRSLHDKVVELTTAAAKAQAAANKSHQNDVFAAILDTEDPMVTVCKESLFHASAYRVKKGEKSRIDSVDTVLSLSSFIALGNSKGKLSIDAGWQDLAIFAVKLSAVQLGEELELDPSSYVKRLRLTPDQIQSITGFGGVHASKADVRAALQAAVNALFGMANGKPRFFVTKADVRALSQQFGWKRTTNAVVIPKDDTMIDMFFSILRHVVGGVAYNVEVVEQEKKSK